MPDTTAEAPRRRRRARPLDLEAIADLEGPEMPPEVAAAAAVMEEWSATKKKASTERRVGLSNVSMVRATRETELMINSGDWTGASGRHFVALYMYLHLRVYGIEASELGPKERGIAAFAATRLLGAEFAGEATEMAAFVRWAWQREIGREKWRRSGNREGSRLGWRLLFGGSVLSDYRLDLLRKKAR